MSNLQIITANIKKGGVGKTTIIYNLAYYLQKVKHQRVLLADFDESMNLTNRFIQPQKQASSIKLENQVTRFFSSKQAPVPLQVDKGIDLIAGDAKLSAWLKEIQEGKQRNYLLSWYYANKEALEERYDYILFDTHNDHSMITDNVLAVSDKVLAIADVDSDSMGKLTEEQNYVEALKKIVANPMTGESFVSARVLKIGNKVEAEAAKNPDCSKATKDHRLFVQAVQTLMSEDESFLGYFWQRGPFAKAKTENQSLFHLKTDPRYNKKNNQLFYESSEALFERIAQC
ncbi:ParA family protein [Lactococcus lactis]|uniref:Chromosome partitioning protein n=1 Tax=Lactococcus lactis TaxID=1358 RepID=A0AAW5TPF6_9LACT|nr:ParA family protein [Lactococcus lactis]MCW2281190.1 chromosome partitioning protein [Lactococcus lactis]